LNQRSAEPASQDLGLDPKSRRAAAGKRSGARKCHSRVIGARGKALGLAVEKLP